MDLIIASIDVSSRAPTVGAATVAIEMTTATTMAMTTTTATRTAKAITERTAKRQQASERYQNSFGRLGHLSDSN
jgi:hypothetical protein